MTKQVFLNELQMKLSGLPSKDLEERLSFYSEMIDDITEEGSSEEEAVARVGSTDEVTSQILADYPFAKIVKEKVKSKHSLRVWEIVLLILGSPVWLSLLIAAFAVLLSVYIVIWSVVISLWAAWATMVLVALVLVLITVIYTSRGNIAAGIAMFGTGLFLSGCSVFMFFGTIALTKGVVLMTKKI